MTREEMIGRIDEQCENERAEPGSTRLWSCCRCGCEILDPAYDCEGCPIEIAEPVEPYGDDDWACHDCAEAIEAEEEPVSVA